MKKIILAAAAASFLSTGAHAVQLPAEGQVCSDIHSNISVGINNPELSDYRKCVMIQHDIETAFTYKTFHVRTGDKFTSFPVEDLAKMNRSERVEHIKDVVIKEVVVTEIVEVVVEKIIEDNTRINELKSQVELLESLNGEFEETISDLNMQLAMTAQAIEEAARVVEALTGELENTTTFAEGLLVAVQNAENVRYHLGGTYDADGNIVYTHNVSVDRDAILETARQDAEDNGWSNTQGSATASNLRASEDYAGYYEIDLTRNGQTSVTILSRSFEYGGELSSDQIPDADSVVTIEDQGGLWVATSVFVDNKEILMPFGFGNIDDLVADIADKSFAAGFERGFSEGYNKGFDDGFERGYKIGFADGFDAGIAAVK